MTRVKGGTVSKNRRRKVLKRAKGYFGSKHRVYKKAQEQLFHSGAYSFNDRKKRANDFRKLWITRINAACRSNDIVYSKFINGLKKANVEINRKMLSELAIFAPEEFTKLVKMAKDALEGKATKESKEVKENVEKTVEEKRDYSKLTVAELKELCEERNIDTTDMKKADLVAALEK
jgi:large subunit ribosomal protein L20